MATAALRTVAPGRALLSSPSTASTTSLLTRRAFASPSHPTRAARTTAMAAAKDPAYEIWVKGDPKTETLLDCPFCHRALLTAEIKAVPYTRGYIDFAAKPDWLLAVNPKGAVPVAKDLKKGGEWVVGSDVICDRLEDEFPSPKMGHVGDAPDAGSDVFPAFVAYLKAPAGEDAEKKAELDAALGRLAEFLAGRSFIGPGDGFGSGDASLAPKLHHMAVALPHFKNGGWEMPAGAKAVGDYLARVRALPAWKACAYSDDAVIAGWNRHLAH